MRRKIIAGLLAIGLATTGLAAPTSAAPADAGTPASAALDLDATQSYEIVEPSSGNVLSAVGTGSGLDPQMVIAHDTHTEDQLWHVVDIGSGQSRIVNDHTGKSLSTVNGGSGDGAIVHLWDYLTTYPDQHWLIQPTGDGTMTIANAGTGNRLMSTTNGATSDGTPVQLWDPVSGRTGQHWHLVPQDSAVTVNADQVTNQIAPQTSASGLEDVNHEVYGGSYSQLIFGEAFQEQPDAQGVSDMWAADVTGTAQGTFAPDEQQPFKGDRSQQITFASGKGSVGVEDRGLNRQGINVERGKRYDGQVTLRGRVGQDVQLRLEDTEQRTYAKTTVRLTSSTWKTYDFEVTPNGNDTHAQFAISLIRPGSVDAGYAFLEPGAWGRYQGLPVRRDVADALVAEGVKALRYGGSAINAASYRWKDMIGPRATRPVTAGTWYPYESNGFGVFDFLNLTEAMGIEGIPSLNVNETPQDISDLMDYLFAPTQNPWGAKRAADGHPQPYSVDRVELGNEEAVNDSYWQKFQALASVIWQKRPTMKLVVGDFSYGDVITDPFHVTGAASGITSLAAHQKILALAKSYHAEVDFDVHIWTEVTADVQHQIKVAQSYAYWLNQLGTGATHKVEVFELNANIHNQQRALANAYAINQLSRDGDFEVVSSANALQVDGQNDNGWDQGLVFLNQSAVWRQPPSYVEQMNTAAYQPDAVATTVAGGDSYTFDVTAAADAARTNLTLRLVNTLPVARRYTVQLNGFTRHRTPIAVTTLTGSPSAVNTATNPQFVVPVRSELSARATQTTFIVTLPPNSYTTYQFS